LLNDLWIRRILLFVAACQTAVHKKCHDKLLTKCPESGRESENTIVSIAEVTQCVTRRYVRYA
jgi:hypothetical protein